MNWFESWTVNNHLLLKKGIYKTATNDFTFFADRYLALRTRENRIYSDQELLHLPEINNTHPHFKEWKIRKKNAKKLRNFIDKNEPQTILEIGAGNGWLSSFLSRKINHNIIAQDINETELEQAARVFKNPSVKWICAPLDQLDFPDESFDHIIFASSIQYFENPGKIFSQLNSSLKSKGKIHITDSPLYNNETDALSAKERTKSYFSGLGFPELALHYHHHCMNIFEGRKITILQKPSSSLLSKFPGLSQPFYRIAISKI